MFEEILPGNEIRHNDLEKKYLNLYVVLDV